MLGVIHPIGEFQQLSTVQIHQKLKHMKQSFNFEVDDENELQISFEESDTIEGTSEEENEEESERSEY